MDINEYISSGTLELYVAGALSADEAREVERLAAEHPRVRAELDAIEATFEALLSARAVSPRPELRATVLEAVAAAETGGSNAQSPPPPATVYVIPRRVRYMMAASISVAVLSTAAAGYFGYRWNQAESDLADAHFEIDRVARQQGSMKARFDQVAEALSIVRDARVVTMNGLPIAPGTIARVYWNQRSGHVRLDPGTLPSPPAGKQYQLWAIVAGKPVDAGLLPLPSGADATPFLAMKDVADAQAFAVTLEPKGGSNTPTGDAMYVMGSV